MVTQTLTIESMDQKPIIPDEDLERLIAEMFGRARRGQTAPAPVARQASPAPVVAPPAPVIEPRVAPPPVDAEPQTDVTPLRLADRRRGGWTIAAIFSVVGLAAGWAVAASGWFASSPGPESRIAPVIAAPPSAATRAPQAEPAALSQPAPVPAQPAAHAAVAAPPETTVAVAPPVAPVPAPAASAPMTVSPPPQPASAPVVESAGVLGTPQVTPFDAGPTPRAVRTTAVLPPRPADAEATSRPIDFDDPATWPAGAERADPHPLPPRRP